MRERLVDHNVNALALAHEFVRRFAEKCDPSRFRVMLLGSRARGDAERESDIDLFVEIDGDDADRSLRAWADEVAAELTLRHGIAGSLEAVAEEGIAVEP